MFCCGRKRVDYVGLSVKEMNKKYLILDELLGKGAFSRVMKGTDVGGDGEYAVKIITKANLSEDSLLTVHREVHILRQLSWPNIIKCHEMFEDDKSLYIFTEFASGGELFEKIIEKQRYVEEDAKNVVRRIAFALRHCFKNGVIHRDLKPDNILLKDHADDSEILLADFGFATRFDLELAEEAGLVTPLGTPNYVAPEIVKGKKYNYKCDIWSLGVITYVLLCGYLPFGGANTTELFMHIRKGHYTFASHHGWDDVSNEAKDFVRKLLVVRPQRRMNYDQLVEHEWIRSSKTDKNDLTSRLKGLEEFSRKRRDIMAKLEAEKIAIMFGEMGGMFDDDDDEDDEPEEKKKEDEDEEEEEEQKDELVDEEEVEEKEQPEEDEKIVEVEIEVGTEEKLNKEI